MTNEPKAGTGIDPELLAAYIDRRLSPEQIVEVEARLASDPDAYALLIESMKAMDALSDRPEGRPNVLVLKTAAPRRRWLIATGALAAAASIVVGLRVFPAWFNPMPDASAPLFAKLVDAVGDERYVEPRLSGGFRFGPLRPVARAETPLSGENLALMAAAAEARQAAESAPSAETLHAWGIAQVLMANFDGAVSTLERAAALGPTATITSDLAAALLARSAAAGDARDAERALVFAEQAMKEAPTLLEARFNRALALERLRPGDADAAWADYRRRDSSPWSQRGVRKPTSRLPGTDGTHL